MSQAPSLPPGTLLAGKFRIERELGAGAMGAVYAIQHELTRHRRALKLLHADAREVPELVQRFLNEASAAGRAGNAHLVETFDAGTLPSGEPYVVMELLQGETLTTFLERQGLLRVTLASELVAQAAEGMAAAHAAGIIHRDLKPDNLFVTNSNGQPFVKILDFGVSKFASESGARLSQTRAGVMYGSPAYMSPEQLVGSLDVDPRTDVFGLGVVLFQVLTGKLPFDAPTLHALHTRLLTGDATPILSLRPDLPVEFAELVHRALASERERRFPSAQALVDALSAFRGGPDNALVAVPALAESAPRPARKHYLAIIGALSASAIIIGFVWRGAPETETPALAVSAPSPPSAAMLVAAPPSPSSVPVTPTSTQAAPVASQPPRAPVRPSSSGAQRQASPVLPAVPSATEVRRPSNAESLGLRDDNPFR